MRYTQGLSVINLLIVVLFVLLGTWGASRFAFEREFQGPEERTQSYGSFWNTVRTITWTAYTDKEFRFALRYPSNWTLRKSESESGLPLWYIGRAPGIDARVSLRRKDSRCGRSNALTVVSFEEKIFPVCILDEEENLWYVAEFPRGKELYELSCSYDTGMKNCYNFFFSFNFTP